MNTEGERNKEERAGEGWDRIHEIWWYGDVDNVFSVQLREKKEDHNHFLSISPHVLTERELDALTLCG